MLEKDKLNASNATLADYSFRQLVTAHTKYNAHLWCYVHPVKGEIKFVVEQGNRETWFDTLPAAIAAYNVLEL